MFFKFKKYIIILVLILSLFTLTYGENLYDYDYLKIKVIKNTNIDLEYKNSKSFLDTLFYYSRFYPLSSNNSLYVNKVETNYNYEFINNTFIYKIKEEKEKYKIIENFTIEKVKYQPEVKEAKYKIENNEWTKFTGLIDIDNNIRKKASELAVGEDDTFEIAVNIAEWINKNIEYDLSSIELNPNVRSTWVFKNRKGVCKEITNLYISMLRSLGIPSRVVVGYSYTDEEIFDKNWQGHAWAEVLIDNKWVPFDVTYSQYGYVDPTHIEFSKLLDTTNLSKDYVKAKAYNLEITNFDRTIDFKILDKKKVNSENININLDFEKEMGIGSKTYFTLKIKNNNNFYKYLKLKLAVPEEIEAKKEKNIVLKPNEEKIVKWNFEVDDNLDENYIYTIPFIFYNDYFNISDKFIVSKKYKILDEEYKEDEDTKISYNKLEASCSSYYNKSYVYNCTIINKNNNILENYRICFNKNCFLENFYINEKKNFIEVSNLNSINFSYKINKIELKVKRPVLKYNYTLKNSYLFLNYSVINFNPVYFVRLKNNKNVLYYNNKSKDNLKIYLNETNLTLELLYKNNTILESKNITIKINKSKVEDESEKISKQNKNNNNNSNNNISHFKKNEEMKKKDRSFFEIFIDFLKSIFLKLFQ